MNKKPVLSAIALAAAAAVLLGVYFMARPETTAGEKELTIQVVHGDQSEKSFEVTTSAEFLADVLQEHDIAQGEDGPYGLYILTADGETVDEGNQEWWCVTRCGESLTTGACETPVADGVHYELTLTVGYGS